MDSFFKYANAAQKAVITGITSAHKEFFENLDSNQTKLEFVVGEEQKGVWAKWFAQCAKLQNLGRELTTSRELHPKTYYFPFIGLARFLCFMAESYYFPFLCLDVILWM